MTNNEWRIRVLQSEAEALAESEAAAILAQYDLHEANDQRAMREQVQANLRDPLLREFFK